MSVFLRTALLCTLVLSYLFAQGKDSIPTVSKTIAIPNHHRFYAGLGYNRFNLKDRTTQERLNANAVALRLGYDVNDYFALEARYTQSAKIDYQKGLLNGKDKRLDSRYDNLSFFVKFSYPIDPIKPYLLMGYAKSKITDFVGSDRKENAIAYGMGISYRLTDDINIFVDYANAYDDKGFDGRSYNDTIKIRLITLGLTYCF